jgi:hypothetical protein
MEGLNVRNRTLLDAVPISGQTATLSAAARLGPMRVPISARVGARLIRERVATRQSCFGKEEMTKNTDEFARYSLAEKQLCDEAGPVLSRLISKVERDHDVTIHEFRVTLERTKPDAPWGNLTCTIVR